MNTKQGLITKVKKVNTEVVVFIGYMVLCIVFAFASPVFFTVNNFMNIGIYSAIMGVTASGMTLAFISGGFDISVGAIMALSGMATASLLPATGSPLLAILIGVLMGAVCGVVNGILVTKAKINPLIATLSMMNVYRGISYLYTDGMSVAIANPTFRFIGSGRIGPVPILIIIMLVFFVVMFLLCRYTAFGRSIYAVGGNARASFLSGINVNGVRLTIWIIIGLTSGVSGVMQAAQTGVGLPSAGEGMEMDIIAACVLGGCSVNGGKGSVWGTLVGVLILSTLSNGMTLLNIQSFWQMIVKGVVLVFAVLLDVLREKSQESA